MNGWPDWAILAVAPPDSLAMYASDESRDNTARAIVPGTGEYNALVELESGDEDRGIELAQKLAKQTRRDVYLLLLSIHASLDDRVAFVVTPRGKPKRLDDDPDDVATRLGCPLPRPPRLTRVPSEAVVYWSRSAFPSMLLDA